MMRGTVMQAVPLIPDRERDTYECDRGDSGI